MKSKTTLFTMLLAALCIFLFAPQVMAENAGFDDKKIRVAQFGPQTGPAAPWGAVARGAGLLFQIVNEEGGIHGRKIKYFSRDDQYNPAQTAAIVKELVERHGIFSFTGGVSSAGGNAVKGYLAEQKVLWVTPGSAAVNSQPNGETAPLLYCVYNPVSPNIYTTYQILYVLDDTPCPSINDK